MLVALSATAPAGADQSVIKHPGMHPDYAFEAEPHVLIAPFKDVRPGVGFRGTFEIVDNGFVSSINNSVGIGVGVDLTKDQVWIPVVMQWNFWLTRNWSVFGEPGLVLPAKQPGKIKGGPDWLAFYAGGRFHFSDAVALTLRVGRPTLSIGVSFLL